MILGEIRRFLRDDGMIKVSRPLKELAGKVGAAREKLEADLGEGADRGGTCKVRGGEP